MKQFFIKIGIFIACVVISDVLFGKAFDYLRVHSSGGDTKRSEDINMRIEPDIILLGASTCLLHLDPNVFERSLDQSVYNCGEGGHGIIYEYGRFRLMINRYKPKYVIYTLIEGFDLIKGEPNEKFLGRLRPYYGYDDTLDSYINKIDPMERYKSISSCYRYNSKLLQYLSDFVNPRRCYDKGFIAMHGNLSYEPQRQNMSTNFEYDDVKLYCLKKLIMDCNAMHIPLIFIVTPFYRAQPGHFNALDIVDSIANHYGILFFNEKYNPEFNQNRALYADPCHFNEQGAELFSRYIVGKIKNVIREGNEK